MCLFVSSYLFNHVLHSGIPFIQPRTEYIDSGPKILKELKNSYHLVRVTHSHPHGYPMHCSNVWWRWCKQTYRTACCVKIPPRFVWGLCMMFAQWKHHLPPFSKSIHPFVKWGISVCESSIFPLTSNTYCLLFIL